MSVFSDPIRPCTDEGKLFPDTYFGETEPKQHNVTLFAEADGPSFKDLLDLINPLQHIPVISTIYRELTDDKPGALVRMAGGFLYGGPLGLAGEFINCAIEDNTGKDVGGHALAFLQDELDLHPGDEPPADDGTMLAMAPPPAPPPAPAPVAVEAIEPSPASAPRHTAVEASADAGPPPTRPMTFGPDGFSPLPDAPPAAPPPPVAAPVAAVEAPAASVAAADASAVFKPVPLRRPADALQPPLVKMPVSINGQRSNVPITGHAPSVPVISAPAVPARAAADAVAGNAAVAAMPQVTAPVAPVSASGQDWFSAAMLTGLDKYQRAGRLGRTAAP